MVVMVTAETTNRSSSSGIHFSKSVLTNIKLPSFDGGKTEMKVCSRWRG
jgi:hypothetical protein